MYRISLYKINDSVIKLNTLYNTSNNSINKNIFIIHKHTGIFGMEQIKNGIYIMLYIFCFIKIV